MGHLQKGNIFSNEFCNKEFVKFWLHIDELQMNEAQVPIQLYSAPPTFIVLVLPVCVSASCEQGFPILANDSLLHLNPKITFRVFFLMFLFSGSSSSCGFNHFSDGFIFAKFHVTVCFHTD